ncbi:MAG: methyltransferase domain-containing protein [Dehalococcoidia bacterium]
MSLANIFLRVVDPFMQPLRDNILQFAVKGTGLRALDVCCGTGTQVLLYAQNGIEATGIDEDLNLIKLAEKRKAGDGLNNAFFQAANALDLPFEDNRFDFASISLALHDKERRQRNLIISEMKRVTTDDGYLILLDYSVPMPRIPSACFARTLEFFAGREHHNSFKDYVKQGGLDELLRVNSLVEEEREILGPVVIVKARREISD